MYKPEEIEGKKFGYLTAIKYSGNGKWECACDCGNIKYVETSKLVKGKIVSCGCKNKLHQFRKTHGMTNTRIYSIWSGMKNRCQNTRKQEYKMYGGRGISICDEWSGKCKYPESVCPHMTVLKGNTYCDVTPCQLTGELPKQSNADRIKNMTDEELAKFITNFYACKVCKYFDEEHDQCDASRNFLCVKEYVEAIVGDWLKQPAED